MQYASILLGDIDEGVMAAALCGLGVVNLHCKGLLLSLTHEAIRRKELEESAYEEA